MREKDVHKINRTAELVNFLINLSFEKLPKDVIDLTKLLILDLIGVGLFSSSKPWSRIIAEFIKGSGSRGEATVFANAFKSSPQYEAMANGTMAHGFEFDDTHDPSVSHSRGCSDPYGIGFRREGKG